MLQDAQYVAFLCSKRAEIRALSRLDASIRKGFFPIIAVRPWPNTNKFQPILHQLDAATAGFRHGFDLDRYKRAFVSKSPCCDEFEILFDPAGGFKNYYDLVEPNDFRVPVLRNVNGLLSDLDKQFEHINKINRGVVVRVEQNFTYGLEELLASKLLIADDTVFVIDIGWSRDVLAQEMWISSIIGKITEWDASVEIACTSSSFPNSFSSIKYKHTFLNDDRQLYARLVARHNIAKVIYGDWGSTRKPEEQGGGKHYDRIDVARAGEWISFRQTDDEIGYKVLADRIIQDDAWNKISPCWGRQIIELTSLDVPGKIKGTEMAISARINMHITEQVNMGKTVSPPDEPYVDDL
ncbi:beta family protein [Sphingomonas prati]|uniref:Uncharacterized protein n=1 Tax=Sphingomonas prati TaxID=1843237 RepID=A0A7W9BUM6_9SPHN|nr:hypothetical protein [Sphingomonas prati]MBB5730422.1 hypothetical protein [Sphingomonas prati]GGE93957.1 hypothetical protein GCM10011404_28750 [Sphingomonas prati]